MRAMFLFFYFLVSFSILVSCNTNKVKYQDDIESIIKKADKSPEKMTQKHWELADQKMEKFKEDFDLKKDQMTREERDKANEMMGKYTAVRLKGFGNELKETISDFGKQMEGAMKELTDSTEK
jgi:isopenicillin N synthase-like dioxygenase